VKLHRMRLWPWLIALIVGAASSGCSTLLPTSKKEVVSGWTSYANAVLSLSAIEPYRTTRVDVHKEGLDPRVNPAITVMHFSDVLQRFSAAALIKAEGVDRGIRDCLHAGKQCSGYAISVKKLDRNRVGNFWLDTFNFKRETVTTGWSVDALLLFVDDLLVYELIGGQPTINEYEVARNPLGPLQAWGDQVLQSVR
jgi:hypothetical protein